MSQPSLEFCNLSLCTSQQPLFLSSDSMKELKVFGACYRDKCLCVQRSYTRASALYTTRNQSCCSSDGFILQFRIVGESYQSKSCVQGSVKPGSCLMIPSTALPQSLFLPRCSKEHRSVSKLSISFLKSIQERK